MSECPKCGHWKIYGPRYVEGSHWGYGSLVDVLVYECAQCGYTKYVSPRDAKEGR